MLVNKSAEFTVANQIDFETLYYPTIQKIADFGCDYIVEHAEELGVDITLIEDLTDNDEKVKNGHIEFYVTISDTTFMIVLDKYTQVEDDTCYVYWYNKELGESAYADLKCNIGTDYVVYPECWDDVTLEDWVNASDGTVNIQ